MHWREEYEAQAQTLQYMIVILSLDNYFYFSIFNKCGSVGP